MASLKRIASDLGVSHTLVSKVLSGKLSTTGVSAKTKEAILSRAKELDYTPNRLAVALKAGRKGSVGIFLHQQGSPGSDIFDRLIQGLTKELASSGLRMWLQFFKSKKEFLAACDSNLSREVDGLIIGGVNHPELIPKFRELEKNKVSVVSLFHTVDGLNSGSSPNVTTDYEMQGYLPTRHLLDQGLQRLICLSFLDNRTAGFVRALREHGLAPDPDQIIPMGGFMIEDGENALRELQSRGKPFDGIVCQSDAQAAGVVNELVRQGKSVPGDVMVTGVDNSPIAQHCIVPITSVSSEMGEIGKLAVNMLIRRIEGEAVASFKISPRLVTRHSTGSFSIE